ncbi:class I SAM-dependent methyltransferase [Hwanghaeella grinnelliae]|uniref:class I SAM-dependent methyltransferase n=1 Tax=Hwanghaeella grinnelliae TaxID=2500179 RepID=UPI0013868807|nr:methyltransferase domain-containing protein [Hwanghaeella grinnelliae]
MENNASGTDDGYIPFIVRFKAWWEGIEPEAIMQARGNDQADTAQAPSAGAAAIEVDIEEEDGPLKSWSGSRLNFCRRLWGEEFEVVSPGGTEFSVRLVRPMALTSENSLLDLSAGLSGGTRQIHKELGVWVTGMERNPELAREAAALSKMKGLDRKVPITAYEPDKISLKPTSFDGVLIRETLYTIPDREAFLRKVAASIRPFGHLVLTDLMLVNEEAKKDRKVAAWLKRDVADASPDLVGAYTPVLEELGFDVRVEEDESDAYHAYVLQGWATFVEGLSKEDLNRELVSLMMIEADFWVNLMRALQAGKVRLCRVHGIKKAPA